MSPRIRVWRTDKNLHLQLLQDYGLASGPLYGGYLFYGIAYILHTDFCATHMCKRMSLRVWATHCSCYTTRVSYFWRFHNLAHLCVALAPPSICRARGQQMFPRCPSITGTSHAASLPCVSHATHMIASVSFKVFQDNWPMVSMTIRKHYAIIFQIKKVKCCSWHSLYPTRNIV